MTFSVGELGALALLLVYGLGALGYAVGGTAFLVWCLALGGLAAVPGRMLVRRRRRVLERERRARREARVRAYPPLTRDRAA